MPTWEELEEFAFQLGLQWTQGVATMVCLCLFSSPHNSKRLNSSKCEGVKTQLLHAWQEYAVLEKISTAPHAFTYFCTGHKVSSEM